MFLHVLVILLPYGHISSTSNWTPNRPCPRFSTEVLESQAVAIPVRTVSCHLNCLLKERYIYIMLWSTHIKQEVLALINGSLITLVHKKWSLCKPQTSSKVDTVHDCKPNVIRREGVNDSSQFCALYLNSHLILQVLNFTIFATKNLRNLILAKPNTHED